MESKIQGTLQALKTLAFKNIKMLESISRDAEISDRASSQTSPHFHSIRHHYDQLLMTSKLSVEKNEKLQGELQAKKLQSNLLRQKLQRNYEYMEDLEMQMIKANKTLTKQRKNQKELLEHKKDIAKLKSIITINHKKKAELQHEISQISQKQQQKLQKLTNLSAEIKDLQETNQQQQKKQTKRISELQRQLEYQKESMFMLKDRSQRSVTPQKKDKSIILHDVMMNIQQFRKSYFE